jgi:hypothetical protein
MFTVFKPSFNRLPFSSPILMDSFCIPWSCVDLSPKQPEPEKTIPKPPKSFVQAVSNVCEIPTSQLPQACVKGDRLAIAIPEGEYITGLDA